MFNYNGCVCDVCKQAFTPESDVVVCPECGTPHHRHCYKELGHCVNESRHSEGFEWKNPNIVNPTAGSVNSCPKCHTENPKDASFCENCGVALPAQNKAGKVPPVFGNGMPGTDQKTDFRTTFTPPSLEGEYNGVSYKDMAIYIGQGAPQYIFHFKNLDKKIKHFRPFSWSACFFDGFYFLYRKMWLQALFVIIASGIISLPSLLIMAVDMGALAPDVINGIGNMDLFVTISTALGVAFKIFIGYWAIPQYRNKVAKDIKRIRAASFDTNSYYQTLVAKSGPVKAVLYIAVFVTAFYFFL